MTNKTITPEILFTPQELLTVAERVMPDEGWEIMLNDVGYKKHVAYTSKLQSIQSLVEFDPETNHDQWRALAEFCIFNDIDVNFGKAKNLASRMIAAVLALAESEKP